MPELINDFLVYLAFIFERLDWLSVLDILLVTAVFFVLLLLLRDTQAIVLVRGGLLILAFLAVLANLEILPAFSWLVGNTLPALLSCKGRQIAAPALFAGIGKQELVQIFFGLPVNGIATYRR